MADMNYLGRMPWVPQTPLVVPKYGVCGASILLGIINIVWGRYRVFGYVRRFGMSPWSGAATLFFLVCVWVVRRMGSYWYVVYSDVAI